MRRCQVDVLSDNLSQGQLYVIGGSNGHSDELSCGERYDPHADEWVQVPELKTNRCNAGQSVCYDFKKGSMNLMISVHKNVINALTHLLITL